MLVSICKKTIQNREKSEKKKPNNIPAKKDLANLTLQTTKRTGIKPNHAKKWNPKG